MKNLKLLFNTGVYIFAIITILIVLWDPWLEDFFKNLTMMKVLGILTVSCTLFFGINKMKKTNEQLEIQIESGKRQRFENSFFQMLSLHSDIVQSLEYKKNENITIKGRACFIEAFNLFEVCKKNCTETDEEEKIKKSYEVFIKKCRKKKFLFGHYFKSLENIIHFIDKNSDISSVKEKKEDYINILQSQLSSYEEKLIFYRVINGRNRSFCSLIKESKLLNPEWVDAPSGHWTIYWSEIKEC